MILADIRDRREAEILKMPVGVDLLSGEDDPETCLIESRELEEPSYKEIAEVTRMPIGAVMSRLWRARRLLLRAAAEPER
ncbi:MAG: sigma factor-like helix-turn-helix DNA-binding protein [Stellaceae bacterium]